MKLYRGTVKPNRSLLSSVDTLGSGLTVTRAHTPATAVSASLNRSSTIVEVGQNLPRYVSGALVAEEARANLVPNPRGEGPGLGVNPTGWGSMSGVVSRGTEGGLDYVDIQFTGAGAATLAGTFVTFIATTPGEINTLSFNARLVAGSLTNVTNIQINILYRDAVPATLLNSTQEISAALAAGTSIATNRFTHTATAPGTAADKIPRFRYVTTGAYDFTIRFAAVQFEVGFAASQIMLPVRGTPAGVTRNADVITQSMVQTDYASRNMWTRSEDFSSGGWTRSNTTFNIGTTAGPYTGTLGDAFVAAATTSVHTFTQAIAGTSLFMGTRYTASIYAKAGTMNFFRFSMSTSQLGGSANGVYFDLTTGAVTIAGTFQAAADAVFTATNIGAGWWRLSVTYTAISATNGTVSHTLQFTPSTASNSYLGDATEGGYVWGAQFTASPSVPAYAQTVAAVAGSHNKGTLVLAAQLTGALPPAGYFPTIASIYDDANNYLMWIYNPAITSLELVGTIRSVSLVDSQFTFLSTPVVNQYFRLALSWDTTTGYLAAQAHNGTALGVVHTQTMDLMPVFNLLGIGGGPVSVVQGLLQYRQVALYRTVTPAASLNQLIAA